jgi:hypothetical protein
MRQSTWELGIAELFCRLMLERNPDQPGRRPSQS